ncbi:LysM peptidoglycan-binding domain-containing protein [Pelotomaculum isophthalicicum JI]|uniref:LysM peptidoglycan-binding domain-containing protein n=1 Tax=Pelotomaculum isophthalicicum JI TaxID=947010 RepID=A0A9X4H6R5_9FIRM|nr:LysM peptidoglycan-binding domain-containing protein [Pelotomaculum isophthalicicum]MDF9409527.1 LysM peptidoglycan-binding domain-containing protein [Pelotomaculum isophthalicicum JI]
MNYTVQAGETLFLIAQKYGVTLDALIAANPQLADPGLIFPGQVINIPAPGPATSPFPAGAGKEMPGAPGRKPLHFISITEGGRDVRGASNVPVKPKFTLRFDKNVVNSKVWENNVKSFTLVSQRNENVPLNVTKVDDTVDFSLRQYIYIEPVNPLTPGTTYTLSISPGLMSLAGETLGQSTSGQAVTITFRTAG